MLQHISIKNYALIEHLQLDISQGFTSITGETGAGKSILLGALGLVLGKRADVNSLRDAEKKCVVEAHFNLTPGFKSFFETYELDYEAHTILRREILPSGKSRAFVNDSPVKLNVVNQLALRLIDVHSQHETLLLADEDFQMSLLDGFSENNNLLLDYQKAFSSLKKLQQELSELQSFAEKQAGDADYLQFLFNELEEANVRPNEFEDLEEELETLLRADEIIQKLGQANQLLFTDDGGALDGLQRSYQLMESIANVKKTYASLAERLNSVAIELDDIRLELENEEQGVQSEPQRIDEVNSRMSLITALQKKHHVDNSSALIEKQESLEKEIDALANAEQKVGELQLQIESETKVVSKLADKLTEQRKNAASALSTQMEALLVQLNMQSARLDLKLEKTEGFNGLGQDKLTFYFSANAGQKLQVLSKVASGGELSRVMLAVKAIMAKSKGLPTIIFDEIDSGVSGETAVKIGEILKSMGGNMQVLAITHLPQIAAKATEQLKVEKVEEGGTTRTELLKLSTNERELELARLLSGSAISEAALTNAKELLA